MTGRYIVRVSFFAWARRGKLCSDGYPSRAYKESSATRFTLQEAEQMVAEWKAADIRSGCHPSNYQAQNIQILEVG